MRQLSKEEIIDLLTGCTVLGTGGGGDLAKGIALMEDDFAGGRPLMLMSVDEVADDALIGTPYGCGAPKAEEAEENDRFQSLPHLEDSAAGYAFRRMEEYMGKKFTAVATTELGGENTAEALHIACMLGLPVMDADPAGRSVPELQHSTYFIKGLPICPAAVATNFGESMILESACDDFRAEEIIRSIAIVSDNEVGVVDHPITGKVFRDSVIPGAVTMAEEIGRIVRENRPKAGRAVAEAIASAQGGRFLFQGKLKEAPWEMKGGFNIGKIVLDGIGDCQGQKYEIAFKNETMVAYRNGEAEVMVPDLICMIDGDGEPFTIPNFREGMEMNVFALPAHELWRTEKGISIFGPRAMGYDVDYRPL
ncbi:MAG: DUF917 domain-containing protein [Firmicutes bacterium]|nr:DUF917 domain-containing protein [Bacillota bacterium]